jgi:hypothetical protein
MFTFPSDPRPKDFSLPPCDALVGQDSIGQDGLGVCLVAHVRRTLGVVDACVNQPYAPMRERERLACPQLIRRLGLVSPLVPPLPLFRPSTRSFRVGDRTGLCLRWCADGEITFLSIAAPSMAVRTEWQRARVPRNALTWIWRILQNTLDPQTNTPNWVLAVSYITTPTPHGISCTLLPSDSCVGLILSHPIFFPNPFSLC